MCDLPHDPVGDPLGDTPGLCFCVNTQPQGAQGTSGELPGQTAEGQAVGRGPSAPQLRLLLPKTGRSREGVTQPRPALCAEGQAQVDTVLKPWVTFNQGGRQFCKQSRGHPDSTWTPTGPPKSRLYPLHHPPRLRRPTQPLGAQCLRLPHPRRGGTRPSWLPSRGASGGRPSSRGSPGCGGGASPP